MYRRIEDFVDGWKSNAEATEKYLAALTDESLGQAVAEGHRTLGRIAWHLVQTIPEMMARTGLAPEGPAGSVPVPATAAEFVTAYRTTSESLISQVSERWTDETLEIEDEMYGSPWKRGFSLHALLEHETHHRGQLSVLMRQAGLPVAGSMGPSKDEWTAFGMEPPKI